jgi:toxin HigB-1
MTPTLDLIPAAASPRRMSGKEKLRDILQRLDAARTVADMDLPAFGCIRFKGESKGLWAVTVRANWRVSFRFAKSDAMDVDYVDYH